MTENSHIQFVTIKNIDYIEWNKFLLTTTESTYFCTTDYLCSFTDTFFLLIRNPDREIIAGIPFRIQNVAPIIGRFFKFCRLDSSVLVNQSLDGNSIYFYKKLALVTLIDYLRKTNSVVLFISTMSRSQDGILYKEIGFMNDKCATFILDLSKSDTDIYKSFSKGNKSSIQSAIRKGVNIKIFEGNAAIPHISEFCRLQDKLFEYKRKSYSRVSYKSAAFINGILSSTNYRTFLGLAYFNGQPAASAIWISHKDVLYYYLGASDLLMTKESNASNLLQYEVIKYAKTIGYLFYDFGGIPFSSDPSVETYGVYKFKKSFGGVRNEYDNGNYIINKHRYWLIKSLQKRLGHPIIRFGLKVLKRL